MNSCITVLTIFIYKIILIEASSCQGEFVAALSRDLSQNVRRVPITLRRITEQKHMAPGPKNKTSISHTY